MARHNRIQAAWFFTVALVALLAACTSPTTTTQYSMSQPVAFALICQQGEGPGAESLPLADCSGETADAHLVAFVANGPTGDLTILDLTSGDPLDTDEMVPGFTRLWLGGYLADIAARPDSTRVYALDSIARRIVTVSPQGLELVSFDLPYQPGRLLYDADREALLVTFPGQGAVGRVTLDDAGLPAETEVVVTGGSPTSLALAGGTVLLGHFGENYVTVLDAETLAETNAIGLLPTCQDGLDNDGDGLVDQFDPGCLAPDDLSEEDPVLCAGTDEDPEDCQDPAALPLCANGLDDDEDGLADLDDPGCRNRSDWTEFSDNLGLPADHLSPFVCANGLDDDGDGLTDFPADADCFAAGGTTERGQPAPAAEVAIAPDGLTAYVVHKGLSTVLVLDLAAGKLVDVNHLNDSLDRRLKAAQGVLGINFGYVPGDVLFQAVEEVLYAYVPDLGGRATRVLVADADGPVHQVDDATEEDDVTSAAKPRLWVDGEEVQLGYTPIAGHPNMGPLLVETLDEESNDKRYYGIDFNDELRAHRNEGWTLEYEGPLPGTSGLEARFFGDGQVLFVGGDLCRLGALPGDTLTVTYTGPEKCGAFTPDEEYNYLLADVGSDMALLDPESGWTETDEGRLAVAEPGTACFPDLTSFTIRPTGAFTVTGASTGYLHNVVSTPDGCRVADDADPLMTGRAHVATLNDGGSLSQCPVVEASDELTLYPFANPLFTFTLFPGCSEEEDAVRTVVPPRRNVSWTFSVNSGFTSQTIMAAAMPADQTLAPTTTELYILDLAGRSIKEVELEEFMMQAAYY